MLTLNDGRNELWQWDTGRTLTVDADCSQVHFSNKVFGRSIDVDVVDGVAIVPDIMLQTDKDLFAWAFVGTPENGYTKISKVFKVNRRNKPSDYVFTHPEQTTLGEILERLDDLESVKVPDAIKNAVEDYMEQNPVEVPDSGGNVAYDEEQELTEEQKTQARANIGAQPVGEYLTEVPEGYAKNEDIKKVDRKVDTLREVVSKFHSNIVEEAKGDIITLDDASDMELAGLTLYGKTIQNGTPTPESPVELESVGDDGNVVVTVCGKNLLKNTATSKTVNGVTFTVNADGSITVNGTSTARADCILFNDVLLPGRYVVSGCPEGGSPTTYMISIRKTINGVKTYFADTGKGYILDVDKTVSNIGIWIQINSGVVLNNITFYPMLRLASDTDETYEPYKGVNFTAQTPNGLPGIPVSSGGNYTDENGQQWICDEIDFARGKYVQRVKTVSIDGSKDFSKSGSGASIFVFAFNDGLVTDVSYHSPYCSHYKYQAVVDGAKLNNNCFQIGVSSAPWNAMRFRDDRFSTVDAVKTHLSNNPFELQYILAEPIETDLSAEEIAQYSVLHTNYPNTTVYNDEGAGMAVKYVADTKLYIDNKFAELAAAILNNA